MKKITGRKEKYPERRTFDKFFLSSHVSSQVKTITTRLMIDNTTGFQIEHLHVG